MQQLAWSKATTGGGRVAAAHERIYRVTYDGKGYAATVHEAGRAAGRPLVESWHRTAGAARAWCEVEAELRAVFAARRSA